MKTHTAICDRNGQRKITSTTETLRIKASEIEPGDWLLKPHGRVMRKDVLVVSARPFGSHISVEAQSRGRVTLYPNDMMVDVERTR